MAIPTGPAELSVEWLGLVLSQVSGQPSKVTSMDVEPMVGEQGMTGELVRLRLRYAEPQSGLPSQLVVKFATLEPQDRALINELGHYERESRFYADLSHRTPVMQPHCYFNHHDDTTGAAVLILEDLVHARAVTSIVGCSVDDVRQVVIDLARLHAAWWQRPELSAMSWLELRSLVAPEAMDDAFHQGWPLFLDKLSVPVTKEIQELGARIAATLPRAVTLYRSGPRTLIHNDVQADNLFFDDTQQRPIFIDWQMVTAGRGVVDVADWIRGQLDPQTRRRVEPQLVRSYHDALKAHGVHDYDLDQCLTDYELATVLSPARLAYAVGLSDLQPHAGAFWDVRFPRFT
jgi:thiamine kinase-like enzyme